MSWKLDPANLWKIKFPKYTPPTVDPIENRILKKPTK